MIAQSIQYRRHLPHFHPDGYPLFVTFRLADSLPMDVLAELQVQRAQELEAIKNDSAEERYNAEKRHFGRYDKWLDRCEHGPHWLDEVEIARIVADKIHSMDGVRYHLLAYCMMPNHVHLLFMPIYIEAPNHRGRSGKYPVTDTMRLIKGSTARECNLLLKRTGKFWNHESYDHFVRNEQELGRIVRYILNNPVKAGLVKDWTDWPYTFISPEVGVW